MTTELMQPITQIELLKEGDTVVHKATGVSYVVVQAYGVMGTYVLLQKLMVMQKPEEWLYAPPGDRVR